MMLVTIVEQTVFYLNSSYVATLKQSAESKSNIQSKLENKLKNPKHYPYCWCHHRYPSDDVSHDSGAERQRGRTNGLSCDSQISIRWSISQMFILPHAITHHLNHHLFIINTSVYTIPVLSIMFASFPWWVSCCNVVFLNVESQYTVDCV